MYEIKPIFDPSSIQVDLPNCMYKMKNISEFKATESQSSSSTSSSAPLTNGFTSAVSQQLSTKSLPDVKQQIEKFIKVFCLVYFKTNNRNLILEFHALDKLKITKSQSILLLYSRALDKNVKSYSKMKIIFSRLQMAMIWVHCKSVKQKL